MRDAGPVLSKDPRREAMGNRPPGIATYAR